MHPEINPAQPTDSPVVFMVPSEASGPLTQQLPLLASKAVNGNAYVLAILDRDSADGLGSQSLRSQCHTTIVLEHGREWTRVSEAVLSLCFAKFGGSDLDSVRAALGAGPVHCLHLEVKEGDWRRLGQWLSSSSGEELPPHELGNLRRELDAQPEAAAFYLADAVGSMLRAGVGDATVLGVAWHARIPRPFNRQLQGELRDVLRSSCIWSDGTAEAGSVLPNTKGGRYSIVLMVHTDEQQTPSPNTGWAAQSAKAG